MAELKRITNELRPIFLLIIFVILSFSRIIYSGDSPYGADFLYQFYPWKDFIYQTIRDHGHLPLWNPFLFSGSPFISNIQASMFYPMGFLYYILPPEIAYTYSTVIHYILGASFMYLFMRGLSVSPLGGLFSAIIFIFNGYFIGHLYAGHMSFVQSYIWLPLIFHFLFRFFKTTNLQNALITGLILGMQALGGFPQITFYSILAIITAGIYILLRLIFLKKYKTGIKVIYGLFIIFLIGFSFSAIQILPTLEFTGLSTRSGGVDYAFATTDSLNPKEFITFLFPDIFGNVVDGTYWRTREGWHFWETCAYVGLAPFFLIFFRMKGNRPRSHHLLFIIIIVIALFVAMGKYNPLYHLIYKLPGFDSFRIPAQIIYLYVFGMAVLSGIGLHYFEEKDVSIGKCYIFPIAFLGIILTLSLISIHFLPKDFFSFMFRHFSEGPIKEIDFFVLYKRTINSIDKAGLIFFTLLLLLILRKNQKLGPRTFDLTLLLFLMIDLGLFGLQFIRTYDYKPAPEKSQFARKLNDFPYKGRIIAQTPFYPNDGLVFKFPSILGYDPLILKRYANYIQVSQNWPLDNGVVNLARIDNPGSRLLKMLNVRRLIYLDNEIEIENDIPYVNFVQETILKDENEILSFMQSDEFDPKRMVVFENKYSSIVSSLESNRGFKTGFSIREYGSDSILMDIYTERPCYLVLSEIYYPGWQARVDGEEVPILCGNYIFRAISVDKGEHKVSFRFVPRSFYIGMIISVFTLTTCLFILFYGYRKKRFK